MSAACAWTRSLRSNVGVCDSVWELLRLVLDSDGQDWSWPAVRRQGVDFADPGNGS